jgi:hypothetical protein
MVMSRSRALSACLALLATLACGAPARAASPVPAGWPAHLLLGMRDDEGGATDLRATTQLEARYHYLSGGVNTREGWTTWAQGDGSFVTGFVADSEASGFLPVFSLYTLRPSAPGISQSDERTGDMLNLTTRATMRAWFDQLKLFYQRAASTGPVLLHVEPDLWGYAQRTAGADGSAADVPAQVAATGLPELKGLPDTVAGVAKAVVKLRDDYARNVELGYHLSVWGTGEDISKSDPSDARIDQLADSAVRFYRSLGASFDVLFAEFADRDAAYAQLVGGNATAWWDADDFARNARFLGIVSSALERRIVMWQVPLGNRVMRAVDDTAFHWADNRVEWLLGADGREHMRAYTAAGVIGFLFGAAQAEGTCACDAAHDGVTDPLPVRGNTAASLSADDDGGYFRRKSAAYYATGPLPLPSVTVRPSRAKRRVKGPRLRVSARTSRRMVSRGKPIDVIVRVTSAGPASTLVAVQLYAPGAAKPAYQLPFRNQRLRALVPRNLRLRFTVPRSASAGRWRIKVGVFDPDWKRLYRWTEDAGGFVVR